MKIVIFGGRGFIGKALRNRARDWPGVVLVELTGEDVRKPETFEPRLKEVKPDVVINLAAILGTMKITRPIRDLFETNVMGNLNVLKSSYEAGVRNYVFASSMTIHGENEIGEHQTRFSLFNPKNGYSSSKAAAEYSLRQFLKEAPDMKIVIVRPGNVLGSGTYLPQTPIEFIQAVLAGKDLEIYGEGNHEREFIWIDDVVEGILKAVEYAVTANPGYYPFFLCSDRISMRNLAKKVTDKLGGKVVFTPSTMQAFTLTSDFIESQSLLKWFPKNNIDNMLDKLIDLFRNEASGSDK